jgi:hypothetical protein
MWGVKQKVYTFPNNQTEEKNEIKIFGECIWNKYSTEFKHDIFILSGSNKLKFYTSQHYKQLEEEISAKSPQSMSGWG